jgi:hypothetical protein
MKSRPDQQALEMIVTHLAMRHSSHCLEKVSFPARARSWRRVELV